MVSWLEPITAQEIVLERERPNPSAVSPIPLATLALIAGILLGWIIPPWIAFTLSTLLTLLTLTLLQKLAPGAIFLLGALAIGIALAPLNTPITTLELPQEGSEIVGILRIDGPSNTSPKLQRVEATLIQWGENPLSPLQPSQARVWLRLPNKDLNVFPGDHIALHMRLRPLHSSAHPGAFNELDAMTHRRVEAIATPLHKAWKILKPPPKTTTQHIQTAIEEHRKQAHTMLLGTHESSGILSALALGQGASVDPDVRKLFARSGLAHVLAVSGLHFGLVALGILNLTGFLLLRLPRLTTKWSAEQLSATITLPILALYVLYVGAPTSAQRAFIMATCLLSGRILQREGHPIISLSIAATLLLLHNPLLLRSVGFQLSFSAVLGLLLSSTYLETPLTKFLREYTNPHTQKPLLWLFGNLLSTLAASLATAPFVLWHFGQAPALGILANLWVIPTISFILLPLSLASALLLSIHQKLAEKLAEFTANIETLLIESIQIFSDHCPWIAIDAPSLSPLTILSLTLLACATLQISRNKHTLQATLFSALLLSGSLAWSHLTPPHEEGTLNITFIPIGQGDATLIETPNGETILIDAGGGRSRDPGKEIIIPMLKKLGYHHIDRVILTHPDLDHYGGLASVIQEFQPDEIWTNGQVDHNPSYQQLLNTIAKSHSKHLIIHNQSPALDLGDGATMHVIWPPPNPPKDSKNNASIVLRIDHKEISFLLPGDLEAAGEAALIAMHTPLGATVLKSGHHGSQTSSTNAFLHAVQPQYAIHSVGLRNRFGLPHPSITQRYQDHNITTFRTDLDGTIKMKSDGHTLSIDLWRP